MVVKSSQHCLIESIAWEARWKNLRWQGDRRLWRNRAQAEVLRACPKRQKAGDWYRKANLGWFLSTQDRAFNQKNYGFNKFNCQRLGFNQPESSGIYRKLGCNPFHRQSPVGDLLVPRYFPSLSQTDQFDQPPFLGFLGLRPLWESWRKTWPRFEGQPKHHWTKWAMASIAMLNSQRIYTWMMGYTWWFCCSPARSLTVSGMRDTYDKTIHPNNTKIAWIEWYYIMNIIWYHAAIMWVMISSYDPDAKLYRGSACWVITSCQLSWS